jgi:hypothetical protein
MLPIGKPKASFLSDLDKREYSNISVSSTLGQNPNASRRLARRLSPAADKPSHMLWGLCHILASMHAARTIAGGTSQILDAYVTRSLCYILANAFRNAVAAPPFITMASCSLLCLFGDDLVRAEIIRRSSSATIAMMPTVSRFACGITVRPVLSQALLCTYSPVLGPSPGLAPSLCRSLHGLMSPRDGDR